MTNPVTKPQLIDRFINWNGEVKTMLIPWRDKTFIKNLIISS